MKCCICKKEANNKVKGLVVCPECIKICQFKRDELNLTRSNPQSKLNTQGESPITLREVVLRAEFEMQQKENNETT